jgi:hypothetical protein
MGRGLIIICTGMVFVFGMIQLSISNRHNAEAGINIEYANSVQSRNYAASGMELAVNELLQDFDWRPADRPWVRNFDNETVRIWVDDSSTDGAVAAGHVRITAECSMGRSTAVVNGSMSGGGKLPYIPAAMAIYSDDVLFNAAGAAFSVNGNDFVNETDPVYGVAGGSTNVVDKIAYAISAASGPDQTENIKGIGGTPSLAEVPNMNEELKLLIEYYEQLAIAQGTYLTGNQSLSGNGKLGTQDNPQITYIKDKLTMTGNSSGAGILIIGPGAELVMTGGGNAHNFNGLVIVQGNARIGGNMKVYGSMLFGGNTPSVSIDLLGHIQVNYHSRNINRLDPFLDSVDGGSGFNLPPKLISVFE